MLKHITVKTIGGSSDVKNIMLTAHRDIDNMANDCKDADRVAYVSRELLYELQDAGLLDIGFTREKNELYGFTLLTTNYAEKQEGGKSRLPETFRYTNVSSR